MTASQMYHYVSIEACITSMIGSFMSYELYRLFDRFTYYYLFKSYLVSLLMSVVKSRLSNINLSILYTLQFLHIDYAFLSWVRVLQPRALRVSRYYMVICMQHTNVQLDMRKGILKILIGTLWVFMKMFSSHQLINNVLFLICKFNIKYKL